MLTIKLKSVLNCVVIRKELFRAASVNNAVVHPGEDNLSFKSWHEIPGPPALPLIGHTHHFLPGGLLHDCNGIELYRRLHETYGPITKIKIVLKPPIVFLLDAESIEQVLRGENWMPSRPGLQSFEYYRKYHNKSYEESKKMTGLVTEQGENWRQFRSIVNPILLQPKTVKLYTKVLEEVAEDMIKRLRSLRDETNKLPDTFDSEMNLWALESIGVVALGQRLNCFDPNLADDSPAKKLIQCIHGLFLLSDKLDIQPSLWTYYPTQNFKEAMKLYQDLETTAKYFVKKSMNDLKGKGNDTDNSTGVLEKLLKIDEEVALVMAGDMLIGGVDTASNTMISTLYLLAINPDKQNQLRLSLKIKDERRSYLKACIKESMRMMPVVGGNMRQTTKQYNLLGYKIPKGTQIMFCHEYLSKLENHYPRPDEYIPERWIMEAEDPLYHGNAHPFAYNPFGFGVRSCVGRRIAELELETLLARIIENFHIEWQGPPPKVTTTTINFIVGPYHFVFKDV